MQLGKNTIMLVSEDIILGALLTRVNPTIKDIINKHISLAL